MARRNALIISLFLAVALVLGTTAMLRTTRLGARATAAPATAQLAAKSRQLDRYERQLRRAAHQRPPALPPLPPLPPRTAVAQAPAAQPAQVVYVRPKPIVKTIHRHGGESGEHEGGHDREGGELDD
jgi:hypothetical protein